MALAVVVSVASRQRDRVIQRKNTDLGDSYGFRLELDDLAKVKPYDRFCATERFCDVYGHKNVYEVSGANASVVTRDDAVVGNLGEDG